MRAFVLALLLVPGISLASEFDNKPCEVRGVIVKVDDGYQLKNAQAKYNLNLEKAAVQQFVSGYEKNDAGATVILNGIYHDGGTIDVQKLCTVYLDHTHWAMICEANRYRRSAGLHPLLPLKNLMLGSQAHSNWMRRNSTMQHADGVTENIAVGQRSVAEVTSTWYNSAGHRANMLGGHRYIGVGYDGTYWTQRFSR